MNFLRDFLAHPWKWVLDFLAIATFIMMMMLWLVVGA